MKVDFLTVAEAELEETIEHYNLERRGLGYEFASEVKKTLQRMTEYPKAWQSLSKNTRRCLTNRFPYSLIYQIRDEEILVVGIMHLKRNPRHWKERLKSL